LLAISHVVKGIKTRGLVYELENFDLSFGTSRGVSNQFLDNEATIQIDEGLLLVIKSRD
jgi:thiamine pyrophosphokinase